MAFVLHDVFGVPFEEIAGIVGRSPVAARKLASRGRRRVRGASENGRAADVARRQGNRQFLDHTGVGNRTPRRIVVRWPGHMAHLDVKKVGRIPGGGG